MHKTYIRVIFLMFIFMGLNACGTKGPLYIPEKEYPQDTLASK
ncbi:MAG TPA: lipoprotein [Methylotenera sp.]|nr:lipoprotein [Methylotenera sp.]